MNTGGAENSTTGAAKEQAGQVVQTAKHAGTEVAGTVKEQAGAVTAEAAHQAGNLLNQTRNEIADWIGHRDPGTLLDEVRAYGRRRPGAFLAISLGAGILAGRLTKGLTTSNDNGRQPGPTRSAVPGGNGDAGPGYSGTAPAGTG